jgi:hypothetical protein
MNSLYVIDTVTFIAYFSDFFNDDLKLSKQATQIMDSCIAHKESNIKLTIPTIVFVEVFEKFLKSEERVLKFKFEVFEPIKSNPDIEIKPLDRDLLDVFISLGNEIVNMEHHDKIILAATIQLDCNVITNDPDIISYLEKSKSQAKVLF